MVAGKKPLNGDVIAALATPPGVGALAVIRISGPGALDVASACIKEKAPLMERRASLRTLAFKGQVLDRAIVTYYKAPRSFTGEDCVEISCHGSPYLAERVLTAFYEAGARPAEPGEFSLRACFNGKMDFTRAEAVNDLVRARTEFEARVARAQAEGRLSAEIRAVRELLIKIFARLGAAVDFSEERQDFGDASVELDALAARLARLETSYAHGRILRDGAKVALAGAPNAGKSTLFNRLVGSARSIVTDVPGTTRDVISATVDLEGLAVTFFDTAGLRRAKGKVEREGVRRSRRAVRDADLVLAVTDSSKRKADNPLPLLADSANRPVIVVMNKSDLPVRRREKHGVAVSAKTGKGVALLKKRIFALLVGKPPSENDLLLTRERHRTLVARAQREVAEARKALAAGMSEEIAASAVRRAMDSLAEITGEIASDDVLDFIFGNFCIGK